MIVHLTHDLMMASTARATANEAGREYKSLPSLNKLEALLADQSIDLLFVDLHLPGLNLDALKTLVDQVFPGDEKNAIGYAQHVATDLIAKAQNCGLSAVMTRGQFHHKLGQLMTEI